MNPIALRNELISAAVLIVASLSLQSTGMALLIVWGRARFQNAEPMGPFRGTLLMTRITLIIVALHLVQVCLSGTFYRWVFLESWESALYFSAASYSTVGCADIVVPSSWRLIGPCESVIGGLMCGLSASFLFAAVTFLIQHHERHTFGRMKDSLSVSHLSAEPAATAFD